MSQHRYNLQIPRRLQRLDLRGNLISGGLTDYENTMISGSRHRERFSLGGLGRLESQGRSRGRLGGMLEDPNMGGRRGGEVLADSNSLESELITNHGMYERPFGYGLQPPMRKCVQFQYPGLFADQCDEITSLQLSSGAD